MPTATKTPGTDPDEKFKPNTTPEFDPNRRSSSADDSGDNNKLNKKADKESKDGGFYKGDDLKKKEEAAGTPQEEASASEKKGLYSKTKNKAKKGTTKIAKKAWKKWAIGGTIAGVMFSSMFSLVGFFSPYKLEFILQEISGEVYGVAENAIEERIETLIGRYITRNVIHGSTSDRIYTGDTFVDTLWGNWRAANFENMLLEDYGVEFKAFDDQGEIDNRRGGRVPNRWQVVSGSNSANIDGQVLDFAKLDSDLNNRQMRAAIRNAVREGTEWNNVLKRRNLRRILRNKYDVPAWFIPDFIQEDRSAYAQKKLDFKKWLVNRTISPFSARTGALFTCILDSNSCGDILKQRASPDINTTDIDLDGGSDDTSRATQNTASEIQDALPEVGDEIIEELRQGNLFARSLAKIMSQQIITRAATALGGPLVVIGIIDVIVSLEQGLDGPVPKALYDMQSLSMVSAAAPYLTVNSQRNAGELTSEEVGIILSSFDDFEKSPLYQTESTNADFSLISSASAQGTIARDCDGDGEINTPIDQVTVDHPVCPNMFLRKDILPVFDEPWYENSIGLASGIWSSSIGAILDAIGGVIDFFAGPVLDFLLRITGGDQLIAWAVEALMGAIVTPACNGFEEGADAYDCLRGGLEVGANAIGEESVNGIGGAYVKPFEVSQIRQSNEEYKNIAWQQESLFTRLFSTESHRSLLAKAIIKTPSSVHDASNSFTQLAVNPLKSLSSAFSAVFSPAQAIEPPGFNPFGIVHYGYSEGDPNLKDLPGTGVFRGCDDITTIEMQQLHIEESRLGETDDVPWPVIAEENYCALERTAVDVAGSLFTDLNDGGL